MTLTSMPKWVFKGKGRTTLVNNQMGYNTSPFCLDIFSRFTYMNVLYNYSWYAVTL